MPSLLQKTDLNVGRGAGVCASACEGLRRTFSCVRAESARIEGLRALIDLHDGRRGLGALCTG